MHVPRALEDAVLREVPGGVLLEVAPFRHPRNVVQRKVVVSKHLGPVVEVLARDGAVVLHVNVVVQSVIPGPNIGCPDIVNWLRWRSRPTFARGHLQNRRAGTFALLGRRRPPYPRVHGEHRVLFVLPPYSDNDDDDKDYAHQQTEHDSNNDGRR